MAELTDFVLSNPIVLDEDDPPLKYARLLQVERLTAPSRERLQEAMRGHEHLEHMSRASEN
ncbi:hypothetical protein X566_11835 [Afipia sp. P52-10]|nr:hypothetical protein X566_11835 [Afipia sp. P52-10]